MIEWRDFQIIIIVLVLMQVSMVFVMFNKYVAIHYRTADVRPALVNTVAFLPKPSPSPSIFEPFDTLY